MTILSVIQAAEEMEQLVKSLGLDRVRESLDLANQLVSRNFEEFGLASRALQEFETAGMAATKMLLEHQTDIERAMRLADHHAAEIAKLVESAQEMERVRKQFIEQTSLLSSVPFLDHGPRSSPRISPYNPKPSRSQTEPRGRTIVRKEVKKKIGFLAP